MAATALQSSMLGRAAPTRAKVSAEADLAASPRPINSCELERLARVHLVCCDMDGTWLGPDHAPTHGGKRALALAEQNGITWVFATGRCQKSAAGVAKIESFYRRPGIYSNGAVVIGKGGKELYSLELPSDALDLAKEICTRNDSETVSVLFNDRNTFYCLCSSSELENNTLPDFAYHLSRVYHDPLPIGVAQLPDNASIQLIHIVGEPGVLDRIQMECEVALKDVATVARNLPVDLVITNLDAHKGFAVKRLSEALLMHESNEKVLCIGDSGNDVTMLKSCNGIGVAMKNARMETLDAAEFCTQATNGDKLCGVLEAIELVCLAQKNAGKFSITSSPSSPASSSVAVLSGTLDVKKRIADMKHHWIIDMPEAQSSSTLIAQKKGFAQEFIGIVCHDTATFRSHTSLVQESDLVLELGCSFGRCTELLGQKLSNPGKQLVGVDTSKEVLAAARTAYPELTFERGDVLKDPMGTIRIVKRLYDRNKPMNDKDSDACAKSESNLRKRSLCVFVDIGGNREIEALVSLLPWIATGLPQVPSLIVVKSETLCKAVMEKGFVFDWPWLQKKSALAIRARRGQDADMMDLGQQPERRMPHPLKAPLRKNPDGVPICRFHNYKVEGCKMHRDVEGHGTTCPYDHDYCHWCGAKGHIALNCDTIAPLI